MPKALDSSVDRATVYFYLITLQITNKNSNVDFITRGGAEKMNNLVY